MNSKASAFDASADAGATVLVDAIVVRRDRVSCTLRMANGEPLRTDSALAQRVIRRYPTIVEHACVNATGTKFGCVIADTSLPHLVEHMAIELQTRASADAGAVFVGTTEWADEAQGIARVELSFADDLVVLRALRDAVSQVNEFLADRAL